MNFHEIPREKVSARLVHKDREDDVFLYNCRTALPAFFDIAPARLASLDAGAQAVLLAIYQAQPALAGSEIVRMGLKGLPQRIEADNKLLADRMAPWLGRFRRDADEALVLAEASLPEAEQDAMRIACGGDALAESARFRAAKVLESVGVQGLPMLHCCAYNDTRHYYFYGKRHEHVPGVMLMEFARQACYAHFYRFNQATRETVNLSILSFNCDFRAYVQSNYPVHITVETVSRTAGSPSRELQHLRASLIQRGLVACVIDMTGSAVPARLFRKLRDVKTSGSELFSPIAADATIGVLLGSEGGDLLEGRMAAATANSLLVTLADRSEVIKLKDDYKFHVVTRHHGIITGEGRSSPDGNRGDAMAIHITRWNTGAAEKFRQFLKMDCFLVESHGAQAEQ